MKLMNFFSAESILRVCEFIAIIAGVLTVAALIGQSFANRHVNRRHATRMLELEANVSEQQIRAAHAETRLLELRNRVSWRILPDTFVETLKNCPKGKGTAEIVFQLDDDEAYAFASSIWHALLSSGWTVSEQPKPSLTTDPISKDTIPFMMRESGITISNWSSVIVLTSGALVSKPYHGDTPLDALMFAFEKARFPALLTQPHEALRPPEDTIRIIVGSRL